jgi:hypothetical protein
MDKGGSARIGRQKGRALQAAAPGRRHLFDAKRKAVFLDWFAGTGNLSWAAREAGVHYRTVLRHRMDDEDFRAAYDLAEAQSVPRLRAWLMQAREEAREEMAAALEDGEAEEERPGGDSAPVNLTSDQAIRLLHDHDQRAMRRGLDKGAHARGRVPTVASNAEVRAALIKALTAHGIRVRAEHRR